MKYTEQQLIKIAKRINNSKRSYLLVDPLQAKHIPVSPSKALEMMVSLGKLAGKKFGEARLVIGFAETATAIGAVVAKTISDDCIYIQTTRENVKSSERCVFFTEEHSHAMKQRLVSDNLDRYLSDTETVVFVDDEFSTGKTLNNLIDRISDSFPNIKNKRIGAVSVINRLSKSDMDKWSDICIESVSLLRIPNIDYSNDANSVAIRVAENLIVNNYGSRSDYTLISCAFPDPRSGIVISDYYRLCIAKFDLIKNKYDFKKKNVLIMGTEECLFPALMIGKYIEDSLDVKSIMCHSTTRSPIGISNASGYPINSGFCIHSFYDFNRDTYIYNLREYDIAVIVTDAGPCFSTALSELSAILSKKGCKKILCIAGEENV